MLMTSIFTCHSTTVNIRTRTILLLHQHWVRGIDAHRTWLYDGLRADPFAAPAFVQTTALPLIVALRISVSLKTTHHLVNGSNNVVMFWWIRCVCLWKVWKNNINLEMALDQTCNSITLDTHYLYFYLVR